MEKCHPPYTLTVLNPSLILEPVSLSLASLEEANTSNQRTRDFMTGAARERCPPTGSQSWVDVRDAVLAHAVAVERPEVAGKLFFLTTGAFCNVQIVDAIGRAFPELQSALPRGDALKLGHYPPGGPPYGYDNSAWMRVWWTPSKA